MQQKNQSLSYLIAGLFPWFWMGIIQLFAMSSLYLGIGNKPWIFPVSFLVSLGGLLLANQQLEINHRKTLIPVLLMLFACLGISRFIFDTTFDGQDYHQEAILKLLQDWNPVSKPSYFSIHHHYPVGSWVTSASVVSFTGMIETGKLFQLLLVIGTVYISYFSLSLIPTLTQWLRILTSIIITFNPVSLVQTLSHYVDGMLGACYLAVILGGVILWFGNDHKKTSLLAYILIGLSIVIGFSLKFTAVPILGMLIIGTGIIFFINQKIAILKGLILTAGSGGMLAIGLFAFHPYMTNTLRHGDPFFPFNDPEHQTAIIRTQLPDELLDKNRLEKLVLSTFSQTENTPNEPLKWKIPFTFNPEKLRFFKGPDTRVGGWGPWFGGMLILSLSGWIFLLKDKKNHKLALNTGLCIVFILGSVFIIPEAWNARYVPQYFFIPVIVMLAFYQQKGWFSKVLLCCLVVNMLIIAGYYFPHNYKQSLKIYEQIRNLKQQEAKVLIPRYHSQAQSLARRLTEYDIP
ncbi:MAG: hypothetical protein KDE26_29325, partial [Bacteroidetes bacterium]|nr:hypothetical protein [Bacteroidota bacterium]